MAKPENTYGDGHKVTSSASNLNSLLIELRSLDQVLKRAIAATPMTNGTESTAPYRGLYISEEDVEQLLQQEPCDHPWFTHSVNDDCWSESENSQSPLVWLASVFGLSTFDIHLLLIAIAPELDSRYERIYAYLQDDVTRKRPTIELALNLLCTSPTDKLERYSHFLTNAPLIQQRLLHLIPDPNQLQPPLLAQYLRMDEQVIRLLLGQASLDSRLMPFCQLVEPTLNLRTLPERWNIKQALQTLGTQAQLNQSSLQLYLQGTGTTSKRNLAEALAHELGARLLIVDLAQALSNDGDCDRILKLILREAWFQGAILFLYGLDTIRQLDRAIPYQCLMAELATDGGITILTGEQPWTPPVLLSGCKPPAVIVVPIQTPDFAERRQCWQSCLSTDGIELSERDLDELTGRFRLLPEQIVEAVTTARQYVRWQVAQQPDEFDQATNPTLEQLFAAARHQSNQKLNQIAQKLQPKYRWEDMVLPPDPLSQLQEIIRSVRHRHTVYEDWGFAQKLSFGKGLNALFAGPSGTGKTMAAEVIAQELSLDLYKIDLSQVVSKYIGETEKNLDRVFREAQTSNAILFFDEADALFGKRSEVKDAHDRYANIEIGYLLQKMEEYEGVAILATNLRANLDEAFARRLQFVVEFPFPDEEYRYRIWQGVFPAQAPLSSDIDWTTLARSFKLSGGNIKNIALAAAFLAVEENQPISMNHIVQAARREFQKIGRAWDGTNLSV